MDTSLPPPDPHPAAEVRNVAPHYTLDRKGGLHDFDFIAGSWRMQNWRLKQRGVGRQEWDRFDSSSRGFVLLGGVTNVDEVVFPSKGWSGMTMRHYDIEKRQWAIYWVNSRDGKLQSPVVGGFVDNVGLFYGEDVDEGRPILVEFRWTVLATDRARWQQSFSYDGGKTWEVNWVNTLERR
jgi:hypothetical protein